MHGKGQDNVWSLLFRVLLRLNFCAVTFKMLEVFNKVSKVVKKVLGSSALNILVVVSATVTILWDTEECTATRL